MQHVLYWISALFIGSILVLLGALSLSNRNPKREEDDIEETINNG